MEVLTLPINIYEKYKRTVKGNNQTTLRDAERKMTRNMHLSKASSRGRAGGLYCQYGKLHFIVSEKNVVVWMKNSCPTPKHWRRNNKEYMMWNKRLGIDDGTTYMSLVMRDVYYGTRKKINSVKWKLKKQISVERLRHEV